MHINFSALATSFGVWAFLPAVATLLGHITFSAAVFNDARKLNDGHGGPIFVGPVIWSIAVLVGGILVALVYWIVDHSALRKGH